MKTIDVSKVGIYFVFAWLALILLVIAGLFIEAYLQTEKAAEWASAIGGFLAVAAAAIIAMAQSRQNKRNIDAQIAAQERSMANQADLQAQALKHQSDLHEANLGSQIRLQRAAFAFQKSVRHDDLTQVRRSAISTIEAAYEVMSDVCKAIDAPTGPSKHFIEIYSKDAELSLTLMKTVQYGHLYESNDIKLFGHILIDITDAWRAISTAASSSTDDFRFYYRGLARIKLRRASSYVTMLNPDWMEPNRDLLSLSDEEAEQMKDQQQTWPAEPEHVGPSD